MKEQAGLMEEVGSALLICVNSPAAVVSRVFSYVLAALQSQGPSAERAPHAPAAEREGRRRSEGARRVHAGKRPSCGRQTAGPTASWHREVMAPG